MLTRGIAELVLAPAQAKNCLRRSFPAHSASQENSSSHRATAYGGLLPTRKTCMMLLLAQAALAGVGLPAPGGVPQLVSFSLRRREVDVG